MDADEESWKSDTFTDAGQSDTCSVEHNEAVSPNEDKFLLQLSNHFEQSKSQQIQQFLRDQLELNRRFGEETVDGDNDDCNIENSEKSLQETELRLKQRLALHRHPSAVDRAKTSMGFYHTADITNLERGDEGHSDTSSVGTNDSGPPTPCSTDIVYHNGYARPLSPPPMAASVRVKWNTTETVHNTSAEHYIQPPKVLRPLIRPKTSMERRSAIRRPQIMTVENKLSYENVQDPESSAKTALQNERQSTLLGHFDYPRSTIRKIGNPRHGAFVYDNKGQIDPSVKLFAVSDISGRCDSLETNVFDGHSRAIRHGNKDHVRASKFTQGTRNSLPSGISSLTELTNRRRDILSLTNSPVSASELSNPSPLDQRLILGTNCRKTANGLNSGDLHKARGISNLNSFGRSRRALAVHRLPPLDSTVPSASSGRNILDPACCNS